MPHICTLAPRKTIFLTENALLQLVNNPMHDSCQLCVFSELLRSAKNGCQGNCFLNNFNVSELGREEGYTVKYIPSPEGGPEGTPEGKGYI